MSKYILAKSFFGILLFFILLLPAYLLMNNRVLFVTVAREVHGFVRIEDGAEVLGRTRVVFDYVHGCEDSSVLVNVGFGVGDIDLADDACGMILLSRWLLWVVAVMIGINIIAVCFCLSFAKRLLLPGIVIVGIAFGYVVWRWVTWWSQYKIKSVDSLLSQTFPPVFFERLQMEYLSRGGFLVACFLIWAIAMLIMSPHFKHKDCTGNI